MDKDQIEQGWNETMGQTEISCTDRKLPGSLPELRLKWWVVRYIWVPWKSCLYQLNRRTVPNHRVHLATAKQHAHQHKDEVIVIAVQAIITRFFVIVTP
jgi:hypothetical protein